MSYLETQQLRCHDFPSECVHKQRANMLGINNMQTNNVSSCFKRAGELSLFIKELKF